MVNIFLRRRVRAMDTEKEIDKKVVFITGGGYGLGRILVDEFYRHGYKVFFTYRTERDSIKKKVEASKGDIIAFKANASDYHDVVLSVDNAIKNFGEIDILVNNAASAEDGSLGNSTIEGFDYTIKNVLYPVYFYTKAVAEYMKENKKGKVINIGSVNGLHGREGSIAYSAAKAGIVGMTKTMAKELAKYNINCNVVAPGYIDTDGQKNTSELIKKLVLSECYLKRLSKPEDVANLVIFLASDGADNITGQILQIDCGQYI